MNEKIKKGNEMACISTDPEFVARKILENAIKTRPEYDVTYRPYEKIPCVNYAAPLSWQTVSLFELYPDAKDGDFAFVDFCISCRVDEDINLNVGGGNICVWYNGECICDLSGERKIKKVSCPDDMQHLPISVKANESNKVRIACKKTDGRFEFSFLISVIRYRHMWANDYLFNARATLPFTDRIREEGIAISQCYNAQKWDSMLDTAHGKGEYVFPKKISECEEFDFNKLCGKGDYCYVYTEAECDHVLEYTGNVDYVSVNGAETESKPAVKKGDKILLRCKKCCEWNLKIESDKYTLPWLTSDRKNGTKAIWIGPFYGEGAHAPEYEWDLSKVFVNEQGEQLYWKFCDGSQLRIYLDSAFFGQWFYALMVGFYGIRDAAIINGWREYLDMFVRNMSFLGRYFDYIRFDIKTNVMPAFMPRISEMNVLDNIGTMGMNLIDGYFISNDKNLLPLIEIIGHNAMNEIPRFEDGTYYRIETMWADDLYMSCPFLVRMGRLTGDKKWHEEAISQVKGFVKRLYIPEEKLMSHIYFPDKECANKVPWGRGNGWVMWTLSEILMLGEGDLSEVKDIFVKLCEGIRKVQDESGMWRQVLNRNDSGSYLETSATAMFLLAFVRGVKNGWLDESYMSCIEKAWHGLLKNSIGADGTIYGVCMGSGCSMEAEYYFTLHTIINDDHGTGVVLAAVSEYGELINK